MFYAAACAKGTDALPEECLNKLVCAKMFSLAAKAFPDGFKRIVDYVVRTNGEITIDWMECGPYSPGWAEGGGVATLMHVRTGATIDIGASSLGRSLNLVLCCCARLCGLSA